jgi:hypothetical protein
MVIRSLILLAFLAISEVSFGNGRCTKGSEFEPPLCPLKLEKISTFQIEENGAREVLVAPERSIDCSVFKLNIKNIRKFFSRAKVADEHQAHYTLSSSPCYASGALTFVNGKKAQWSIGQLGTGELVMDGKDSLFLYCPTCNFKPFIAQ